MPRPLGLLRPLELDPTSFPEFRDRIIAAESEPVEHEPRSYPGYPRIPLPRARARLGAPLDRVLRRRRSRRQLGSELPSPRTLGRLLEYAHGVNAPRGAGPTPTAGSLNALELYLVTLASGWLRPGRYHYDRAAHELALLGEGADRNEWAGRVPSSAQFEGGALFFVAVGDAARASAKYGDRAARFLLLEAGHLMQNLCLLSESVGRCTLPLGGFFEREIARALALPTSDVVLYLGVLG